MTRTPENTHAGTTPNIDEQARLAPPCAVADPALFFPEGATGPDSLAAAKAVCAACPTALICLADALARDEQWGVWGGELFEDGVIVAVKRRPGRPRKNPAPTA